MLGCCWISWAETRLHPSERAIFTLHGLLCLLLLLMLRWHSHTHGHTSQVPYRAARRKFASYEHVRGHFRKQITSYHLSALLNLYLQDIHTLILGKAITGIQAFT